MTTGYGINGIGWSPLGNVGLGSTGTFANYDYCMPTSMGMMGTMPSMYGMGGMYNYMNPEYMTQMGQRIENSQLTHATNMHGNVKQMEVTNNLTSTDALVAKMFNDGGIQEAVAKMKSKIDSGDLEGAVQIHKELKSMVYNRFKDELANRGDEIKVSKEISNAINEYYNLTNHSNLRADIENCGEDAFYNGFNTVWKKGHSKMTVQEAKLAIYGDRIDNAGSEKSKKVLGQVSGSIASVFEGAGIGAGLATAGTAIYSLACLLIPGCKRFIPSLKTFGNIARIGIGLGAVGNTAWKFL